MEICRNCYYFTPKEDRACKKVFCDNLDREIRNLMSKTQMTNEDIIKHFGDAVNSIIKEMEKNNGNKGTED